MRKALGFLIFAGGLAGLGYWAHQDHATHMQSYVLAGAEAKAAETARHDVNVSVSGRDIRITGTAHDEAERDAIVAALDTVKGRRVVVSDLAMLQSRSPYEMKVLKTPEALVVQGAAPDMAAVDVITTRMGETAEVIVDRAAGEPADWAGAVVAAMDGLDVLETGELTLSDQTVTLSGIAGSDEDIARAEAAGELLPAGYTWQTDVIAPKATDMRMVFDADAGVEFSGITPKALGIETLGASIGVRDVTGTLDATGSEDATIVSDAVAAIAPSIGSFETAELSIIGDQIAFSGKALRSADMGEIDAALSEQLGANAVVDVSRTSEIATPGQTRVHQVTGQDLAWTNSGWLPVQSPYTLTAEKTAEGTTGAGFAPDTATRDILVARAGEADISFDLAAGAPDVAWSNAVGASLDALRALDEGRLDITGDQIVLTGRTGSRRTAAVVQQTIAGLPDGYEASTAIQAPPAPNLTLTYDGNSGLNATGNLPGDLTAAEIASALAVQDTSITVENDADGDKLALLDPVLGLGAWIGELESAKLTIADEQVEVVAETLPAADLDLVRKGLGEALGDIASLEVTTTSATYPDGHRRRNQLTGLEEEHQSGFWLPVLNFETGLDTCQDQTDLALAARKVAFLTGSSKLDVSARAAINSLAGVIRRCVADTATLKLEIGGHTDSQGSDVNNQRLSEARAQAVREALVGRGVPADRVEAVGYGETQPVADNGTAEGRAQNRRTEIRWIAE